MKPLLIDRTVKRSCFKVESRCGLNATPMKGAITIKIKRAGTKDYLIEYPADINPDSSICFEWGDIFYNLKKGRYVGDIFENNEKIGRVQFQMYPSVKTVTTV